MVDFDGVAGDMEDDMARSPAPSPRRHIKRPRQIIRQYRTFVVLVQSLHGISPLSSRCLHVAGWGLVSLIHILHNTKSCSHAISHAAAHLVASHIIIPQWNASCVVVL